jgi:hypothetical protein
MIMSFEDLTSSSDTKLEAFVSGDRYIYGSGYEIRGIASFFSKEPFTLDKPCIIFFYNTLFDLKGGRILCSYFQSIPVKNPCFFKDLKSLVDPGGPAPKRF